MPHIKQEKRPAIKALLQPLIEHLKKEPLEEIDGELNYAIARLLIGLYTPKYFNYSRAMGVLETTGHEFYRCVVAPYEEKAIERNGSAYE